MQFPELHKYIPECFHNLTVGMTEKKAKEAGYEIKVGKFPFSYQPMQFPELHKYIPECFHNLTVQPVNLRFFPRTEFLQQKQRVPKLVRELHRQWHNTPECLSGKNRLLKSYRGR